MSCVLMSFSQSDSCITVKADADVFVLNRPGYEDTNYGNYFDLLSNAWTYSGDISIARSLIHFDYTIPAGATIDSAKLSFYTHVSPHGNGDHSGNNASYIQRVTDPWEENTATWNNKPTTTTTNQVTLAQSTSPTQNYTDIDVTDIFQDIYDSGNNYGIMLRLQTEAVYSRLVFASKEEANTALHPELTICYTLTSAAIEEEESALNIYPNPSNGNIFIEGDNLEKVTFYNSLGQKVLEQTLYDSKNEIHLSDQIGILHVVIEDKQGNIKTVKHIVN